MKRVLSLLLVVFMLFPIFAILPVSAAEAAIAPDAKSFTDPVNAGSDKYYTTKTLLAVDFSRIKSDAELSAAGVNYLDVSTSDSYGVSYVDDGLYYTSHTAKGYLVSNVKFDSAKSYIVDFTFRVNPGVYILQASGVIPSNTDVSQVSNKDIDNSAFKIRPNSGTNLSIDAASYYSDAKCSNIIGAALGEDAKDAAITNQEDVRVKLLVRNGEWEYGEVSVDGKTYYVKTYYADKNTNVVRTGWTGYFGIQSWSYADVVFKNLTISECAKDATDSATVVSGDSTYRVAAGTAIDTTVYNKNTVAVEVDGNYSLPTSVTAVAGKTYNLVEQSADTFVSPVHSGSAKYYTKKVLQTVDFTSIKSDADLAAAGMTYLDAAANDGYGLSYAEGGVHYRTGNNAGFLLSNVKMSSTKSYIADFTLCADASARVFVASAAFPDKATISEAVGKTVDGRAFKLRLLSDSMLSSDGAKYYSDSACTTLIGEDGTYPDAEAQEAAITDKKDVRVRLLFTGGTWQYGEIIVEGRTYYIKANSAKKDQTGYFGFAGFGLVEVLLKNLTISECVANPTTHAFVKSGDRLYRVSTGQTINALDYTAYNKNTVLFNDGGKYSASVTTVGGKIYEVTSLDDVKVRSVGATARLKTDSGLRFASGVDKEDVAFLETLKTQGTIRSYSYGTVITLAKYAKELDNNLTHDALDAFAKDKGINVSYVDVEASDWYAETDDSYIFVGSIVNIDSKNYTREYASVGYIVITMADGSEVTIYADYTPVNSRSVSYVAACAYYDKSVSYTEAQTQMLTAFIGDRKYYPIAIDGVSEYTVVYDADDATAKALATEIADAFAKAGVTLPLKADTASVSGKGLYIGATSHALSAASTAYYLNGQIGCDASGNIAVTGNIEVCAEKILEKINNMASGLSKTLLLDESVMGLYTLEGFGNAPEYTGSGTVELKYSFEKADSYYILIHGATAADYENYLKKIVAAGYECYHSTEANGQKFSTYTDGYNILTMSHVAYYDPRTNADPKYDTPSNGNVSYMTIAIDCVDKTALPERNTEIEDITTEQITTVSTVSGYVLRLRDGRFVIFDGGQTAAHAKIVYDILCEQNVLDGKPVIAAWFLTHGHGDHVGGLFNFIAAYSDLVEVEAFVHNLPAYEQYNGKNIVEIYPQKESDALYSRSLQYYADIERYYPDADIIVARAGQRFEYGDIDIDILFTSENLYKKQMLDTNGSSVVYSITGKSGRMLILGDLVDPEGGVLNAVYGSSLKCDLVQVAHHGYNNGNPDMYDSMDAEYAIWTNSLETIVGGKKHIQSSNKRNKFNYKSVDANLIPSTSGPAITLTENMTKADIVALDVGLTE